LELQRSINSESFEESGNFALKNISKQIKLKYGKGYGIEISSREGIGTCVYIKMPAIFR
jgi:sensor histidine kinase YesM